MLHNLLRITSLKMMLECSA